MTWWIKKTPTTRSKHTKTSACNMIINTDHCSRRFLVFAEKELHFKRSDMKKIFICSWVVISITQKICDNMISNYIFIDEDIDLSKEWRTFTITLLLILEESLHFQQQLFICWVENRIPKQCVCISVHITNLYCNTIAY